MTSTTIAPSRPPGSPGGETPRPRRKTSLFARGEPLVWLTGGALVLCLVLVVGLVALVLVNGLSTFWPQPVVRIVTPTGTVVVGEVTRTEAYRPATEAIDALPEATAKRAREHLARTGGESERRLVRTGNYEITNTHFLWVNDFEVVEETRPEWIVVLERVSWGRFYGTPVGFRIDGEVVATDPAEIWRLFEEHHGPVRENEAEKHHLEKGEIGSLNRERQEARDAARRAEGRDRSLAGTPEHAEALREIAEVDRRTGAEEERLQTRIRELDRESARYTLVLKTGDGREKEQPLAGIVRACPVNRLSWLQKLGVYASRWWEFLSDEPREANSEGGVFPAIFGTLIMTLLMSILVVPFGVLAALYLREYAKPGLIVSTVRIAINNLAGVPSIVYGIFGLGFFCYILGASIDDLFYWHRPPGTPTYGKGGILWASVTLALLTLPVVIVATEEALAAVPGSMREGSYACGAGKWQTIRRIVLPRAMPGIMTGMILAMARGAGEVAPLMLVGAVKLAPELPVDAVFPYVHPERSFMHLGFHIYDVGFQSQNSEAARPMVFTTTLVLLLIVLLLNVTAILVRTRLRRKFVGDQF